MAFGKKTGGRKPGTPNKNRQRLLDFLLKSEKGKGSRFDRVIQSQFELSQGVWVRKEIPTPKGPVVEKVYFKEPDQRAGQLLIEQAAGKATQAIELSEMPSTFDADKYVKSE